MKAFFFVFGFIWILTSVFSFLFGLLFGFNKKKVADETAEIMQLTSESPKIIIMKLLLLLSYMGFLYPARFPLPGLIVGFASLILFSFIKGE